MRPLSPSLRRAVTGALTLGAAAALTVTPAGATGNASGTDGGNPADSTIGMSGLSYPYSPAPGHQASFPYVSTVDRVVGGVRVPEVWLTYSQAPDAPDAPVKNSVLVSHDGGSDFTDRRDSNIWNGGMTQLPDGSLMTVDFKPAPVEETKGVAKIRTRVSTDGGKRWILRDGKITLPAGMALNTTATDAGFRAHKGLTRLADGTLLVPIYNTYKNEKVSTSTLMQSRDNGRTWTVRGRMSVPRGAVGSSEATYSRTTDGRMIAVLRGAPDSAGLFQTTSTDDGRTWSTPERLAVPGAHTDGAVEPSLLLQPNGQLLLAYGRPDNHVMVSPTGTGKDWRSEQMVFANAPADGPRDHGSSGNMSLAPLDSARTLVVGDTCAPWGCQELDEHYKIFSRRIDAVGPGSGKLDLRQMVADGRASITGTFAPADRRVPQQRPQAVVDGSASPMAAAKLKPSGRTGTQMTIALDRAYPINRVGLMLAAGVPSDARVHFSVDGKTWSSPVISADKRVDYAMRYQNLATQQARYVRISAPSGGTLPAVGELELYQADVDSFENEVVGSVPRGWSQATGAKVVDALPASDKPRTTGYRSSAALRLMDQDSTSQSHVARNFSARAKADVTFQTTGINRQGGLLFEVMGTDAAGKRVTAYHVHIDPISKKVNLWDGKTWNNVGTLKTAPAPGQWFEVHLTGDSHAASITVDGQTFSLARPTSATTSLTGIEFASAGTAFVGSSYLIDDVRIA